MSSIASALRCHCGHSILLTALPTRGERWQAHCGACLDGAPDAPLPLIGYGETPDDALWDWQDKHDDSHQRIEWWPVTTVGEVLKQASAEFERQRGWTRQRAPVELCDIRYPNTEICVPPMRIHDLRETFATVPMGRTGDGT